MIALEVVNALLPGLLILACVAGWIAGMFAIDWSERRRIRKEDEARNRLYGVGS